MWKFWGEFVTGVATGLTVAIILGGYGLVIKCFRKYAQKSYIRALILDSKNRVLNEGDKKIRHFYYIRFLKELESTLERRSHEISYDDKKRLLQLLPIDEKGELFTPEPDIPLPPEVYKVTFEQLERVDWL